MGEERRREMGESFYSREFLLSTLFIGIKTVASI